MSWLDKLNEDIDKTTQYFEEHVYDNNSNKEISLKGLVAYQIIDSNTSGTSAIARAGIGAAILGPVGLAAGLSAKKKYDIMLFYENKQQIVKLNNYDFKTFLEYVAKNNINMK